MGRIDWTTAALRIIAVWIALSAVSGTTNVVRSVVQGGPSEFPLYFSLILLASAVVLPIGLTALCWFLAPRLARLIWLDGRETPPVAAPPLTPEQFEISMLRLLGVWIAVTAISHLAFIAAGLMPIAKALRLTPADLWTQLLTATIQLVLSYVLAFRPDAILRFVTRARSAVAT